MTVQRFRKKPVEIEAMQWDGTAAGSTPIINWVLDGGGTARWHEPHDEIRNVLPDGTVQGCPASPGGLLIDTLEGTMCGDSGDWIIRGIQGEFYPCKPDIFDASYEPVEEPPVTDAPPENVRLELDDGTTIHPTRLSYNGMRDGLNVWLAIFPMACFDRGMHIRMDVLPPLTSVAIQFEEQP